jgi:hypothetical protein
MENGETKKKTRQNWLALFEKKIKSALRLLDSNPFLFMVPCAWVISVQNFVWILQIVLVLET